MGVDSAIKTIDGMADLGAGASEATAGVSSSWASISARMLSGLAALLVAELGSFVHLDEGLFRVVEAKFSDEVGEDLVEWPDESAKIWCGFAALGEAELMSSEEILTRDNVG
ncbi:hypothetical protein Peur_024352 [Populus x canadensis]